MQDIAQAAGLRNRLDTTIRAAIRWLEENQAPRGFWVGKLESNSAMEAEWILAMYFLGVEKDPKLEGVVRAILEKQRLDGSWEIFYGAPNGDISITVECYAALRCAGLDPDCDALVRARTWILARGFHDLRVFTRIWLALLGEWPWDRTPQLPPELIFLPTWFPFNIYHFSSWARATIVPLATLSATRPVRPLPEGRRLDELFPGGRDAVDYCLPRRSGLISWESVFLGIDRLLWWYAKLPIWHPFRESAIRFCLEWVVRHQDADGAWGGIQPPWVYSLMALSAGGYSVEHPVIANGVSGFNEPWAYQRDDATFIQASNSPVWDTFLSLLALYDCGVKYDDSPTVHRALHWLLSQEVDTPGDWRFLGGQAEPSGWAFEYENDAYPDCDDTAVGILVLQLLRDSACGRLPVGGAIERSLQWLLAMQSSSGGWAAFDKDNSNIFITKIPFADFGEALDPPSVDVTAHVVEALGYLGRDLSDPVVKKAVDYILSEQEKEGSWFGRWGVNHIYGTGAVLPALRAVGQDMSAPFIRQAAGWLVEHQNADGGWGETCSSYMDDSLRGVGESTPSQTAWALLALVAVGSAEYDQEIERGIEFLLSRQNDDGTWDEPQYTGAGFPGYGVGARTNLFRLGHALPQGRELSRAFMINYNLYRHYFPMMALGRARKWLEARDSGVLSSKVAAGLRAARHAYPAPGRVRSPRIPSNGNTHP